MPIRSDGKLAWGKRFLECSSVMVCFTNTSKQHIEEGGRKDPWMKKEAKAGWNTKSGKRWENSQEPIGPCED